MPFKNDKHKKNFAEACLKFSPHNDSDCLAALYVLSGITNKHQIISEYIITREIDFPKLLKDFKPWSTGEKALVKLAATLFNSTWKATVNETFTSLGDENVQMAIYALRIRYLGVKPNE